MIYCFEPKTYPTLKQAIEQVIYLDENGQVWKIARVKNGFFVRYFGDSYFKETYFSVDLTTGEHILIKNTNCVFIESSDFETFELVRNVIKNGYTDEIWETFEDLFRERLEHNKALIQSEIVK